MADKKGRTMNIIELLTSLRAENATMRCEISHLDGQCHLFVCHPTGLSQSQRDAIRSHKEMLLDILLQRPDLVELPRDYQLPTVEELPTIEEGNI